jgi:hypothetical protein
MQKNDLLRESSSLEIKLKHLINVIDLYTLNRMHLLYDTLYH